MDQEPPVESGSSTYITKGTRVFWVLGPYLQFYPNQCTSTHTRIDLELSVLPKDSATRGLEDPEIKPLTLRFVVDTFNFLNHSYLLRATSCRIKCAATELHSSWKKTSAQSLSVSTAGTFHVFKDFFSKLVPLPAFSPNEPGSKFSSRSIVLHPIKGL